MSLFNWILLGINLANILLQVAARYRRPIMHATWKAWHGYLITARKVALPQPQWHSNGAHIVTSATETRTEIIRPFIWWKCVLPWPGKRKWMDTVITKAVLAGATIEFQAVSVWDWDEAWVVIVDDEQIIASSSRVATALAYLKHKGVEA